MTALDRYRFAQLSTYGRREIAYLAYERLEDGGERYLGSIIGSLRSLGSSSGRSRNTYAAVVASGPELSDHYPTRGAAADALLEVANRKGEIIR